MNIKKADDRFAYMPFRISGYSVAGSSMTSAYQIAGYARVIDVDEVAALLVLTSYENREVEILILK